MNAIPFRDVATATSTLLWLGDTSLCEFRSAYQYCVRHAAQIAFREDVLEAVRRPASDVGRIIVARANRNPARREAFAALSNQYPEARWIDLLGPLCEGIRQSSIANATRVAWHRWEQVLPDWLQDSKLFDSLDYDLDHRPSAAASSVAVIASSFDVAQAYLDLAEFHGVTAVWCQSPDSMRVRNIEAVWWDDSAATPVRAEQWRDRVSRFSSANQAIRHVWITHTAWLDQQQAAIDGGIGTIISKPFRIDSLLTTLSGTPINRRLARQAA